MYVTVSVYTHSYSLYIYLSIYPSIYLSIYPSIYLSIYIHISTYIYVCFFDVFAVLIYVDKPRCKHEKLCIYICVYDYVCIHIHTSNVFVYIYLRASCANQYTFRNFVCLYYINQCFAMCVLGSFEPMNSDAGSPDGQRNSTSKEQ